jgi:hypothetical protein
MSFHPEHNEGCPARYDDGDCDEDPKVEDPLDAEKAKMHERGFFLPAPVSGETLYVLNAKGLDALGFPELAKAQRDRARERIALRERLAGRNYALVDSPIDHEAGDDAPAGAGHDVEADRG